MNNPPDDINNELNSNSSVNVSNNYSETDTVSESEVVSEPEFPDSENQPESVIDVRETHSAALLDLFDNQERANIQVDTDILAESRVETQNDNVDENNDVSPKKTKANIIDSVLEEDFWDLLN